MTETNEQLEGIAKIENTIAYCVTRIDEIEIKKHDIFNKLKNRAGDISKDYLSQLINLKNEKEILIELSESCELDLRVLNLLRPVDPKTSKEFENRANQIDNFLLENEVNRGYVETLRTFRNQLMSESRWSTRPEPRKVKQLPWS